MEFKASVIIPVYNASKTLTRCVESLVLGCFREVKVILVDDCSADESWNVCQELSREYENVFCFQNPQNSGVSATRNRGIREAEGKYILFADSDDWVSRYFAEELINTAEEFPAALPICGLHFYDYVSNDKRDYIWQAQGEPLYHIEKKDFWDLTSRFHLQQIWNKAFRKDIVDRYDIHFDTTQSMGEDYQFVLDYLKYAQIEECVVINRPLYYYIRYNNSSLMSHFGLTERKNEYSRLDQLLEITGDDKENIDKYEKALEETKLTSIYHAVHNDKWTRQEKIEYIEQIMGDGKAEVWYKKQNLVKRKEKIKTLMAGVIKIPSRVEGLIRRKHNAFLIKKARKMLTASDFSVISQNCIGGVFYHDMGLKFLSPTIDLFFSMPDFVKFVLNLDYYISCPMTMSWEEEYPIGYLEDIKVCFQHYNTCKEALGKWEERKKRINFEKIIVLCTDMEGFDEDTYQKWLQIPYHKLLFTAIKSREPDLVEFPEYRENGKIRDLIPQRKFYRDNKLLKTVNSCDSRKS